MKVSIVNKMLKCVNTGVYLTPVFRIYDLTAGSERAFQHLKYHISHDGLPTLGVEWRMYASINGWRDVSSDIMNDVITWYGIIGSQGNFEWNMFNF